MAKAERAMDPADFSSSPTNRWTRAAGPCFVLDSVGDV